MAGLWPLRLRSLHADFCSSKRVTVISDESGDEMAHLSEVMTQAVPTETATGLSQHATDLLIGLMYADRLDSESNTKKRKIFRGGRPFFERYGQIAGVEHRGKLKKARRELELNGALDCAQPGDKSYQLTQTPWQIFKQFNGMMASPVQVSRTYDVKSFSELLKRSSLARKNFPLNTEGAVMLQTDAFGSEQPLMYAVSPATYHRLTEAEARMKTTVPDTRQRLVNVQAWSIDPALISGWLHAGLPTPQADPIHQYLAALSSSSLQFQKEAARLVAAMLH